MRKLFIVLLFVFISVFGVRGQTTTDDIDCKSLIIQIHEDNDCRFFWYEKEITALKDLKCIPVYFEVVGNVIYYEVKVDYYGDLKFYPIKADVYLMFIPSGEVIKTTINFNQKTCE